MAVYVDDFFYEYGRMRMSHLWSPDLQELNDFADRLGLQRKWLQEGNPEFIHYDVCKSYRRRAIELGAIPVSVREMVKLKNGKELDELGTN